MYPGDVRAICASSSYTGALSFRSLDESVAVVDGSGNVYAADYGCTDIIVTDEAGAVGKYEVIVTTGGGMEYSDIYSIESELNSVELKPMKTNFAPVDELVDEIFAQILTDDMTPGQKLKACYDYLATQCTYGYDGYKAIYADGYMSEQDREIVEFSYCILRDRIGTCENFGAAFTVMTRRIGFETNFVYGDVGLRPEYNYGMYRYNYIETVHGFKRW